MVAMEGNGGADKITIGVCVMEKKVRILALWFLEVSLFLPWWFTEFANTWMIGVLFSNGEDSRAAPRVWRIRGAQDPSFCPFHGAFPYPVPSIRKKRRRV